MLALQTTRFTILRSQCATLFVLVQTESEDEDEDGALSPSAIGLGLMDAARAVATEQKQRKEVL